MLRKFLFTETFQKRKINTKSHSKKIATEGRQIHGKDSKKSQNENSKNHLLEQRFGLCVESRSSNENEAIC